MPARPSSITSPYLTLTRSVRQRSTLVIGDDGSTSTTHSSRPRRVASVCLVYVQFVSESGSGAYARRKPRFAMASIETSTTGLSGAVPAAGGRGKRRAAGILGYRYLTYVYPYHDPYHVLRGAGPVAGGLRGRRNGRDGYAYPIISRVRSGSGREGVN